MITINSPKQGNMTAAGAALSAETDFIVGKSFNAAPFGTSDFITEDSSFEQYGSMTKNKQNMISQLACGAPADKPYIANWGSAMPNLYFSEASVMTAAFSAQKNWSAIQRKRRCKTLGRRFRQARKKRTDLYPTAASLKQTRGLSFPQNPTMP